MAEGPQRSRLDTALDTADVGSVTGASSEWRRCAVLLGEVARALDNAAAMDVRGSTGTSMKGAFTRSAKSVREKIERLEEGRTALIDAHTAIITARQDRVALDADNPGLTAPGDFRPDPEKSPEENQTARGLHQGAVNDYWDRYARREAEARRIADSLDTKYADSVEVMKRIHGETEPTVYPPTKGKGYLPKPVKPGSPLTPPGSVDPPAHWDPSREWEPTEPRHHDPLDPHHPTDPTHPPRPTDPHDPFDPHVPSDPGGFDPVTTGGAVLGGGLGLAGLTNAIRGGLAVPGQAVRASGPVRPIGSTSRAAVSGALGRSGAMGAGSPTTAGRGAGGRAGGVGGTRGAVGRGVGAGAGAAQAGRNQGGRAAGGRGAGGRGAAASGVAGGRRGGGKDEDQKTADRDLFDDGQDWIADDEGASPVLD
jgi:hypothetical protein